MTGCGRAGGGCPGCGLRSLAGPRGECGAVGPAPSGPRSRRPCPGGGARGRRVPRGPGRPRSGPRRPARLGAAAAPPPAGVRQRRGAAGSVPPGPCPPRDLPTALPWAPETRGIVFPLGLFHPLNNRAGLPCLGVLQRSPRASTKGAGVPSPTHLAAADRLPGALLAQGQVWPRRSGRSGNLRAARGKPNALDSPSWCCRSPMPTWWEHR